MITYVKTDLFESPAQVLVNTVNTVGVMGKGIAKQYKEIYPEMFNEYQKLCEKKLLDVGKLWIHKTSNKWILNFPTKKHWRSPSKVEYIEAGLRKFVDTYAEKGITSISFPLLGCGNGGLDWESVVQPLMEKYLRTLPIDIFIHLPARKEKQQEHLSISEMKKWLRSTPALLSYYEVWDDLLELSKEKDTYYARNREFSFEMRNDEETPWIRFKLSDLQNFDVTQEQFSNFWNYLRHVGFSLNQELPHDLTEIGPYLFTVLLSLDYIETVSMSHRYSNDEDLKTGIRLLPFAAQSDVLDITHKGEIVSGDQA